MTKPSVSVVMPTFNRAHLISGTIESVLQQSFSDFELLVVDDGSKDDTGKLIAERFGSEPRVRYLPKPNGGVSSARNFGLRHVEGRYVAYLDSDDLWKPWKLQLQVACMEALAKDGVGMIWTNLDGVDPDGNLVMPNCLRSTYSEYELFNRHGLELFPHSAALTELVPGAVEPRPFTNVYWGDVYSRMLLGNLCQPSTVMLTRERSDRIGGFDETMVSGEDHAYHLKATRAGPAALLDAPSILYRRGAADQLTRPAYNATIAENYLRTILPEIASAKGQVDLPDAIIAEALAGAHQWMGMEQWYRQDYRKAHENFARSLDQRSIQPEVWFFFGLTAAPPSFLDAVRGAVRKLGIGAQS